MTEIILFFISVIGLAAFAVWVGVTSGCHSSARDFYEDDK